MHATSLLAVLLLSCSTPPPQISGVEPTSGPAGTELTITGAELSAGTTARLGGKALDDLVVTPPDRITGKVPADLPSGPADLRLSGPDGQGVSRNKAFQVTRPPFADPCSGEEQRFTHIPPTADVVKIDRHLPGGEVERSEIAVRDIQGIEVEQRATTGGTCSAIWLRTAQDRVLFDAQKDGDLREQAQKIANDLHKPLQLMEPEPSASPAGG